MLGHLVFWTPQWLRHLLFHQQCMRTFISPHLHQHPFPIFLSLDNPVTMNHLPLYAHLCFPVLRMTSSIFSCASWPFIYLQRDIIILCPLFNWVVLLLLHHKSSFSHPIYRLLYREMICKRLSHPVGVFSLSWWYYFAAQWFFKNKISSRIQPASQGAHAPQHPHRFNVGLNMRATARRVSGYRARRQASKWSLQKQLLCIWGRAPERPPLKLCPTVVFFF